MAVKKAPVPCAHPRTKTLKFTQGDNVISQVICVNDKCGKVLSEQKKKIKGDEKSGK